MVCHLTHTNQISFSQKSVSQRARIKTINGVTPRGERSIKVNFFMEMTDTAFTGVFRVQYIIQISQRGKPYLVLTYVLVWE